MRPQHVPNEELETGDLPAADAPWEEVHAFGHTFHAYRVAGSVARVSQLATQDAERWQQTSTLPTELTRLRLDLFATVRSVGSEAAPDEDTEQWARALVAAIREQLG